MNFVDFCGKVFIQDILPIITESKNNHCLIFRQVLTEGERNKLLLYRLLNKSYIIQP